MGEYFSGAALLIVQVEMPAILVVDSFQKQLHYTGIERFSLFKFSTITGGCSAQLD
jgi:hypothetical protein